MAGLNLGVPHKVEASTGASSFSAGCGKKAVTHTNIYNSVSHDCQKRKQPRSHQQTMHEYNGVGPCVGILLSLIKGVRSEAGATMGRKARTE